MLGLGLGLVMWWAPLDQVGLLILPHLFYKLMAWSKIKESCYPELLAAVPCPSAFGDPLFLALCCKFCKWDKSMLCIIIKSDLHNLYKADNTVHTHFFYCFLTELKHKQHYTSNIPQYTSPDCHVAQLETYLSTTCLPACLHVCLSLCLSVSLSLSLFTKHDKRL